jgi:hypothetical protein
MLILGAGCMNGEKLVLFGIFRRIRLDIFCVNGIMNIFRGYVR